MTGPLVILGGCGGIGRCVVEMALAEGYDLLVLDLPRSLERHPPPDRAVALALDASQEASLAKAAYAVREQHATICGFVNVSGFMMDKAPIVDTPTDTWNEVIAGNLTAAFLSARQFAPLVAEGGAIVLTGSGLGANARPDYGPYAISKAGIAMLTRQLALELAPAVRVNCVAPSAVDTAFLSGGTGRSDEAREPQFDASAYLSTVPLKRLAQPDDVAGPILFLLSDAAKYITGQVLYVNGGSYIP